MSIIERKRQDGSTAYLAQIDIQRKGERFRDNRTFDKKSTAQVWKKKRIKEIEDALKEGRPPASKGRRKTLKDAIDIYLKEDASIIGTTKRQVLETIRDEYDISNMAAEEIDSTTIVEFLKQIRSRPEVNCTSTVLNYGSHLGSIFRIARPAWNIPLDRNAISDALEVAKRLQIATKSRSRNRRPSLDELDAILSYFEDACARNSRVMPMHKITVFAIFSTRRQEEITNIRSTDLDEDHSRLFVRNMKHPGKKIGNDVWCNLPPEAMKIALSNKDTQPNNRIFPYNPDTISARWTRACKILGIEDLRFHDLRHEGISRLFEIGNDIPRVALVSGHRSWSSLQRYTHIQTSGDKYENWNWIERICRQ